MAEALHLANRTSEAIEAINEAGTLAERFEQRVYSSEVHWLRGVFLTALGAHETQIEASFCEAIRIAKEQKSISLEKRAEGTYAEYRRQIASGPGGRGFRLPLWFNAPSFGEDNCTCEILGAKAFLSMMISKRVLLLFAFAASLLDFGIMVITLKQRMGTRESKNAHYLGRALGFASLPQQKNNHEHDQPNRNSVQTKSEITANTRKT
jgi:hypothetical protein